MADNIVVCHVFVYILVIFEDQMSLFSGKSITIGIYALFACIMLTVVAFSVRMYFIKFHTRLMRLRMNLHFLAGSLC